MATLLVPLHVASDAEVLSTVFMFALVRLLTGMRVGVDLQGTRSREWLATCLADIALLSGRVWG